MVDSSKVRVVCPLVSFLFARLGASLDTSSPFLPLIENFIFEGCGLGVVVGELFPMLSQSINWFRDLIEERERMSEVQFSKLKTGLSFNDGPVEEDTAVSSPQEVRVFHALEEVCGLDVITLGRFKDRFQFPKRVRVRLPNEEDRALSLLPRGGILLRGCLRLWVEVPHPSIPHGAVGLFWHCSWVTYAQLMENSGQLYGDMAGC